jgi:NHL repeat-containing protein
VRHTDIDSAQRDLLCREVVYRGYRNHALRKVSPGGVITTVAGTGAYGYSGDGGPAASALMNQPSGVAVDAAGNVCVSDTNNFRVRKVSTAGIITTGRRQRRTRPLATAGLLQALRSPILRAWCSIERAISTSAMARDSFMWPIRGTTRFAC